MRCLYNVLFVLAILILSCCGQDSKNFENIFGTPDKPKIETNVTPTTSGDINLTPSSEECRREDGEFGVCVTYYQCDAESKNVIDNGETLIDIRLGDCPKSLDVCCLRDKVNVTKAEPRKPPPASSDYKCGYSNPGAQAFRITGDANAAEYGEFPWMIAVLKKTQPGTAWSSSDYLGGGSLINPSVVLTAAHKIDGLEAEEIKCRAGEWDTQTEQEEYPYQERNVKNLITHEDFYRPSVLNNVALLFVESPFELAPHIGLVCLGHTLPPPGTRCFSMGWGKENYNDNSKFAVILKKIEVPLVGRTQCRNALRGTRLGSYFQLHTSLTCAGGESGKDTCAGDGGSSLVCSIGEKKDLRFSQYGAVAWGIGCGDGGVPGVYVHLINFRDWIANKLREEGLDPSTFDE